MLWLISGIILTVVTGKVAFLIFGLLIILFNYLEQNSPQDLKSNTKIEKVKVL